MSGNETMSGNVITALVAFFLLLLVVSIALGAWRPLYPFFKGSQLNQDPALKEKVIKNFDAFSENANKCYNVDDKNCICDGFPDFPAIFHSDGVLATNEYGALNFYDRTTLVKESTFDGTFLLSPIDIQPWRDTITGKMNYFLYLGEEEDFFANVKGTEVMQISFSENYPQIKKTKDIIVSGYLIKGATEEISFIVFNPALLKIMTNPDTGQLLYKEPSDLARVIEENIKKMPKCLQGRYRAIEEFDNFVDNFKKVNGQKAVWVVNLPPDFSIDIINSEISLKYDEEIVKKEIFSNLGDKINPPLAAAYLFLDGQDAKYSGQNILCSNSQAVSLTNQDIINFNQEDACLSAS